VADIRVDIELLKRYEAGLDPRRPERSAIASRILAYGQVSTVIELRSQPGPDLAYKRLPMFQSEDEAERYVALHRRYVRTLGERAGVRVAPCAVAQVQNPQTKQVVVYVVQEQMPEDAVCCQAIYRLSAADIGRLVLLALQETAKVFDFNRAHQGDLELGFDAEISNWAIVGFDPVRCILSDRARLAYLDTSTPMMRRRGQEQLDPELLLRSAPSLLAPLIRRTFLQDVIGRYYDFRRVALDLVASFQKEGRGELVPGLVDTVNWFFLAERQEMHFRPLTIDEIRRYHRWDALIWRLYLMLRKLDRAICRVRGVHYPYILPQRMGR
jgi:hypothetical protein